MNKGMLYQRVAIIAGGNRGIGKEVAVHYAREGCTTILLAREEKALLEAVQSVRKETKVDIGCFAVDIAQEAAVQKVVQEVIVRYKRIDILVNAASVVGPIGPFETCSSIEWGKTIQINLMGTVHMIKAVLPYMLEKKYGSIINFIGGGAFGARPRFSAYSVSKAAVVRLTDALARELEGSGISVNGISPGQVNTKMFDEMVAAGEERVGKEAWKEFQDRKKTGGDSIADVARLALFLVSEIGRKITGRVISAKWDPWGNLPKHLDELMASDIYTMRRIKPEDHGKRWK